MKCADAEGVNGPPTMAKKLLWRGNASDDLTGNPEKNSEKLSKDVASMFKHFPPSH
jgi:hypothetical protein